MSDIIELPASSASFIKFPSPEGEVPKALSISTEGFIAIMYPNSLLLGVIGYDTKNEAKRCILNNEIVNVDFNFEPVFTIADCYFVQPDYDSEIVNLMLDRNFNFSSSKDESYKQYAFFEWSPMDAITNTSNLAISRWDGRIVVIGRHQTTNLWEKEFDVTDLYYKYYMESMLKSKVSNSVVECKDVSEYIDLKNDLKLIDFSWSVLTRQFNSHQYFLLVTLSSTGIIVIWRVTNQQKGSRCESLYSERLNLKTGKPLNIKFCDLSDMSFLITIINSNDVITCFPYSIVSDDRLTVKVLSPSFTVNQQARYSQKTKIHWSMKLSQLIVGFEWKLFISKISQREANRFECESAMIYLPSNSEVSGLSVKENTAYVCSRDGCMFGVKLSASITSIELNQIIFANDRLLPSRNEFIDLYVSPNSVYFGFLNLVNGNRRYDDWNLTIISLMSDNQVLNVLMDESVPFSRKQDAVEEMRHLYFSMSNHLQESINKIGKVDTTIWNNGTLHRLKFVRYICIFFGYRLNDDQLQLKGIDCKNIRRLESVIIIRWISQSLSAFCEISNDNINRLDCVFVLRLVRKLRLLAPGSIIAENLLSIIDVAEKKSMTALKTTFYVSDSLIERYRDTAEDTTCPVCEERCEFDLFRVECKGGHVLPRCCKTLEACSKRSTRLCAGCGAAEKVVDGQDLSSWRLSIVTSNCPLCDGKMLPAAST